MSFDWNDLDLYDHDDLAALIGGQGSSARATPERRDPPPKNPDQAGGRNNYFASVAGKLRRAGLDSEAILAAIRSENATKGYELPDRELATIARSVGGYEVGGPGADPGTLEENVRHGFVNHGVRVDAVGRLRNLRDGALARNMSPGVLADKIWKDLRKLGRASAEDINRLLNLEIRDAAEAEREKIAARILGKPETAEALEEVRRFVFAITGAVDKAVIGGFLQFMWCVKRSLAGLTREHDIMPVLYNQIQGNGKSTAVRRLVSPMAELVDSITVETLADERKKADLGRFVIGVWDEMEGADKRDTDAIKSALSSQEVSYRPMRTNDNVSVVRTMNFIGTSNKPLAAMVRDSSGNRRFVEVETLPRLDHDVINGIDYPLLWQAVSEMSQAPAKAVLGDIRTHQAIGRFKDSVALWMESEDWGRLASSLPIAKVRAMYTEWCEDAAERELSSSLFESRLTGEGFKRTRPRLANGARPHLWLVPERLREADDKRNESNERDAMITNTGPENTAVRGTSDGAVPGAVHRKVNAGLVVKYDLIDGPDQNTIRRETGQNPLMPKGPDRPDHGTSAGTTPWPKPPRPGLELWVYDCEVFPNRFMLSAFNGAEWVHFDETTLTDLHEWTNDKGKVLAGFNNHGYDDILLGAICANERAKKEAAKLGKEPEPSLNIYELSCRIIDPKTDGQKDANFRDRYKKRPWAYSIDVFQLLNGKGALKEWECRIGFPTVAESPAPFDRPLDDTLVPSVREYCQNDVRATAQILLDRWHLVQLRDTLLDQFDLGTRAYCLSEQALAQATFLMLHKERTDETSGIVREKASADPDNNADRFPLAEVISQRVGFTTPAFQATLDRLRAGSLVRDHSWFIELEGKPLDETFPLAGCEISLGVGGLHTVDKPGTFVADAETAIVDLDVTSYYPSLMISERVFPTQIGEEFLADLTDLRTRRVAAKRAGDKNTSEALKIVLNATFGKLNDTWSPIRSVKNAFRVTMNGQMFLLMLMEDLHNAGFEILSANTDGVTVRCPRSWTFIGNTELDSVVTSWELRTGMGLERTLYARVCRRDVNTYIALTEDGKVKSKGAYNPESGKGDGRIVRDAAMAYLLHGTDPAETVGKEADPVAFLFYQRAKNGGDLHCGDKALGKTARWYVSTDGQPIKRKNPDGSFDTIPNAHKAALALDITGWTVAGMPSLDRAYYVSAAWDLIRESGA